MKLTKNVASTETVSKQLSRASSFVSAIAHGIQPAGDLPTVKLAIFTDEMSPSSSVADEVHFHKDLLQKFSAEWKQVGAALHDQKTPASLTGFDFQKLVFILAGVAFMKSVPGGGVSYQESDMAVVHKTALLVDIDTQGEYLFEYFWSGTLWKFV